MRFTKLGSGVSAYLNSGTGIDNATQVMTGPEENKAIEEPTEWYTLPG